MKSRRRADEVDPMRTMRAELWMLVGVLLLAAQSSLAQPRLGITAAQRAGDYRALAGKRLTFVCPATDGATAILYGTDTYTEDSPICAAAIHAGALKAGQTGVVSIDVGRGAKEFRGSQRNGLTSRSYGASPYSYTVARDGVPGTLSWTTVWNEVPAGFDEPITVTCPAGGALTATIWGTDVYTIDSGICVAAVHAGVITAATGGSIAVSRARPPAQYAASDRNGVQSKQWGSSRDAFSVAAAARIGGAGRALDPCPLAAVLKSAFAAMRTSVTNEYDALLPTAQATNGFDATALTAQRDELLGDLAKLEQLNVRDGATACGLTQSAPATAPSQQTAATQPAPASDPSASGPTLQSGANGPVSGSAMRGTTIADGPAPTFSAQSAATAPPPPNFAINDATPGVARLSWRAETNKPDPNMRPTYRVFRREGPSAPWVELGTAPDWDFGTAVIDDVVPAPSAAYEYRLHRQFGDGTWGEAFASFTSRPAVNPTAFRATQTAADTVTLSWDAAPGAVEYRVDGTGLPNTGKNVAATSTTISPIRGEGTWQLAAIYPGAYADYANRPVASNVSRPLPTHAPAWLSKANGAGSGHETAAHYARLCNPQFQPPYERSRESFCGTLYGVLTSWGAKDEDATHGPGGAPFNPSGTPTPVGYTNVTELASHRLTQCYLGEPQPAGRGLICQSETPNGLSLIIMASGGARFAAYDRRPYVPSGDAFYTWSWGRDAFSLAPTATFDSEGPKSVPHACLACHGGRYDPVTGLVTGASLLPIDPSLVIVDGDRAVAEEKIRAINAIVRQGSYSSPAVAAYIDGLYGGMNGTQRLVEVPGTRAVADYVPQGWATQRSLYLDFVKKDCAMCHLAQQPLDFLSAGNLLANKAAVHASVCVAGSMPHAETAFKRFWTSGSGTVSGPGWFAAALGLESCSQ